jgi:chromosome partitioning protein
VKTLAIGSPKGGVGKTVTAVTLAYIAAVVLRLRVLVIDGDPNRSSMRWLRRLAEAEGVTLDVATATTEQIRELRRAGGYDLLVLDLPGGAEGAFEAAIGDGAGEPVADFLVVPSVAEMMDLEPVVEVVRKAIAPLSLPYLLTLTRVRTEALPRAYGYQGQIRTSGLSVASTVIREYAAVNEAVERGCTVLDIPGRHTNARRVEADYRGLGREVFGAMGIAGAEQVAEVPAWLA